MSGSAAARSVMIYNERTKLIANAYDRASTAMGAGSLLPLINLSKPSDGTLSAPAVIQFALPATISLVAFVGLKLHERNALPMAKTGEPRTAVFGPPAMVFGWALPWTVSVRRSPEVICNARSRPRIEH